MIGLINLFDWPVRVAAGLGARWRTPAFRACSAAVGVLASHLALGALVDLSPPIQDVTANYDGFQVICRVFDPAQGKEYVDQTAAPSLFGFSNTGGVVSWTSGSAVFVRT